MLIKETAFSRNINLDTKNPHRDAMNFKDFVCRLGTISDKKNTYFTDGPKKAIDMRFDLSLAVDNFCRVIAEFIVECEIQEKISKLGIIIEYSTETKTDEDGVFSELFTEYYLRRHFRNNKEAAQAKIRELDSLIERTFQRNEV